MTYDIRAILADAAAYGVSYALVTPSGVKHVPLRRECNCFPHGPNEPCTCTGCWACDGHVTGCTCDIAWDCDHEWRYAE